MRDPDNAGSRGSHEAGATLRARDHLDLLEAHAVFVIRETLACCHRPALCFSGGKDSAVLAHLAGKALTGRSFPMPLLHVDTGMNFDEAIAYRDELAEALGADLVIASVEDAISRAVVADPGPGRSRNRIQSATLLDAVAKHGFDALLGGARRDEDKARAKERVFSVRDAFGQWDPRAQRPELWTCYSTRLQPGEHLRVFPLSDWTELDIWSYIAREHIALPDLYFSHERDVLSRDGMLLAVSRWVRPRDDETVQRLSVRFRTVGDATCTGAVPSLAATVEDVIAEVAASRLSERGATRADDRISDTAMEDRKREGYF